MILLLGVALMGASAVAPDRPPVCNIGSRGSVQLAYKPYGNEIFGSDGVSCRPTWPTGPQSSDAKGKSNATKVAPPATRAADPAPTAKR